MQTNTHFTKTVKQRNNAGDYEKRMNEKQKQNERQKQRYDKRNYETN